MYNINAMLADAAQIAEAKLSMLGGGWSRIVAGAPFAVCGKIDIPWHLGTESHTLRLELIDTDGNPVLLPTDDTGGPKPLIVELPPYQPTIDAGVKPGTWLDWAFAVNVGAGLPLKPGTGYDWRISINGETQEGWSLPFTTLPGAQLKAA